MPLFDIPVVMPYRLEGDASDTLYPVHVRAVASGINPALAAAEVLTTTFGRLQHPGSTIIIEKAKAKPGQPRRHIEGPYAYVFGKGSSIHHFELPARVDNEVGEGLVKVFANACDPQHSFGVIMDCALLTYINSSGLAAMASNARQLRLFRLPPSITKVFELLGLQRMMRTYPSLTAALENLEKHHAAAAAAATEAQSDQKAAPKPA